MIEWNWNYLEWLIPIVFLIAVTIRVKRRGFFWKARDGRELTFKQFIKSWKDGIEGITPIQQTLTSLWSYPLILGGVFTGIVVMIINREWWLVAILSGSLPLTLMGLLSLWQKYKQQKRIHDTMKELQEKEEKFGGEYTDEDYEEDDGHGAFEREKETQGGEK